LSVKQRHVLELAYFRGLSQTQIAEQLNIPLGTVKSRVRNAQGMLRFHLIACQR
jgi:RNA polymerase sigma-70 factor, ECF subfamily